MTLGIDGQHQGQLDLDVAFAREVCYNRYMELILPKAPEQMMLGFTCPEKCVRWKANGMCVHTSLGSTWQKDPRQKSASMLLREHRLEKRESRRARAKVQVAESEWCLIYREIWRTLPHVTGVYVWIDEEDNILFAGKAIDLWRRHYTWEAKPNAAWIATHKLWWRATGWYDEYLVELRKHKQVDKVLLDMLVSFANPLVLPEPPSAP